MSNEIKKYLNQNVSWKRRTSTNKYVEGSFTETTIKGRLESGFKLVRNEKGEEVTSSAFLVTESAVSVNDLIEGRTVVSSEPMRGFNGNIMWYEVYLL